MIIEVKKLRSIIRHTLIETAQKWVPATKKNMHQDGTSKSRGYWSGIDKTWTGQDTNDYLHNWYKTMGMMEDNEEGK